MLVLLHYYCIMFLTTHRSQSCHTSQLPIFFNKHYITVLFLFDYSFPEMSYFYEFKYYYFQLEQLTEFLKISLSDLCICCKHCKVPLLQLFIKAIHAVEHNLKQVSENIWKISLKQMHVHLKTVICN